MELGHWQLDAVSGGQFRLDGGVMFGVVPKVLWSQYVTVDADNRMSVASRCILARNGRHTVLVDTGYGSRLNPLDRNFHVAEEGEPLVASLAALGIQPDQIDTVVLSHLHFDHVGGACRLDGRGHVALTFPRARHLVGRVEWRDATSGAAELGLAYSADNLAPLEASGRLELIEPESEILPGLRTRPTGGHTRGHLAVEFASDGQTAILPFDLCPSRLHLRRMWHLAYDQFPLETRSAKPVLLGEAVDRGAWVLWYHDPGAAASRLARHPRREFVAIESLERL